MADEKRLLAARGASDGRVFLLLPELDGNETVAHMTSGAWSPFLDGGIGYVRFREPGDWIGRQLTLETREGNKVPCHIVPLPFYDAEKRIPRGQDRQIP